MRQTNQKKWVISYIDKDSIQVPVLIINKKKYTKVKNLYFNHSVGGEPIEEETEVQMKYDDEYLKIKFECRNNPRMNQNYYTEDNSPMFTQEVFELFISNGERSLENYLEIQLNPNNALYLAKITNRYKGDNQYENEPLDKKIVGVKHFVEKNEINNTWIGYLEIPLDLLKYPKDVSDSIFRLNMYRIISNEDHHDENWKNNADNSTYGCWSSTMSKRPQFHKPDYFGFLILN